MAQEPPQQTSPETEAEKIRVLEARIRAPSIWGRVPCGLRFEDLQDKRYEDAVKLVKKHYLPEELTYRSVKLIEDKEGTDEMMNHVRIWMKDKMSIAVVKEGIDKLVGVLIMRIQEKCSFSRTFSKVKIVYNENYGQVKKFYNAIEKPIDLFEELRVRKYLKIYILALKARYRHRGIAKELIKAAMKLAAAAQIPAICGIFTTARSQAVAESLGFSKYREMHYVRYLNNNEIIFWDTGMGNYGAVLMAYRIPGVEENMNDLRNLNSSRFRFQPMEDEEEIKWS